MHAQDIHWVTGASIEQGDRQTFLLADTLPNDSEPIDSYENPPVIIAFQGTAGAKDLCTDFFIKAKTFRDIGKVHQGKVILN